MANQVRLDAGKQSDWQDGMMKTIALDSTDEKSLTVLVSKVQGKFYATSSKCTHYGAPLVKGILTLDGCVTCPWHGAKFSVCKDGDIEDAPGLNSLQPFKIVIENDHVLVEVDKKVVKETEFGRQPVKCNALSQTDVPGVVVIGGGAGGQHFVEEIRRLGYNGSVTLISRESFLPIDRTKLSKALITDPKKIALRDEVFYKDSKIEIKLNTSVESINFAKQSIKLSDATNLNYSKLVVSTGASARTLPIDGAQLKGIHTLRSISDTQAIESLLSSSDGSRKSIALIGSSFICMELALFASSKNVDVHIIGMEEVPLCKLLGESVGRGLMRAYEKKGVRFHMKKEIRKFIPSESDPSHVGGISLSCGRDIKCDGVVLGVGAKPNTEILSAAGIEVEKDGGVAVDQYLRLTDPKADQKVYAIGDIAKYPDLLTSGELTRLEHWNVAGNHGRAAARNIVNEQKSASLVPFTKPAIFWSALGQQLRYVGTGKASQWDKDSVEGEPDELNFVAYYYKDNEIVAIATMQRDPMMVKAAALLASGKMPSIEIQRGLTLEKVKVKV